MIRPKMPHLNSCSGAVSHIRSNTRALAWASCFGAHRLEEQQGPSYASIRLLLPVGRARNVGHRHAVVDRLAADRFRLRLLLGCVEHFEHDVARNEADAGVVGDHQVAGHNPNLADLHGPLISTVSIRHLPVTGVMSLAHTG